jgi:cation:H+ antiporter
MLVLGIASIIRPIKIQSGIIKRELPIMFIVTVILLIVSYINLLDKYHLIGGLLFLFLFLIFVLFFIYCARKERDNNAVCEASKTVKNIFFIILGIIGVVAGAWLLIESAVVIADFLRIPAFVIAISMVAVGTSLPELVVSSIAAYKGESNIAVGNVLGSNVFNILLILGFAALFIPLKTISSINHLIILTLVSLIFILIVFTGYKITRLKGVMMLVIYCAFIWYSFFGYTIIS